MKASFIKAQLILFIVTLLALNVACDNTKEVEKTAQEKFTEQIIGNWTASAVTVDNVSLTGFESFSLNLEDGTYTSTNSNGLWPAQGTWQYTDTGITSITRDDGVVMSVSLIDDKNLEISFTYNLSGGRLTGVNDSFKFSLKR